MHDSWESRAATLAIVTVIMAWVVFKIVDFYIGDE